MAQITCRFVRPDKLLYEGPVASLVLATHTGELGVWPGHASEICALGEGVVRLTLLPEDGGGLVKVLIAGGYAEISNDTVIILADHARRTDDIEPAVVRATRDKATAMLESLEPGDHRTAYWENKIHWCDLLLAHAE